MTAQQLKNSILQMAVQGKLVPQDPNDEPASVLLERIRAEKQELIKAGKIKKDKKSSEIFRGASRNLPYAYCEQIGKETRDISDEIPFDIPESWEWCRLKNVVNAVSARRVHQSDWKSRGVPFYRAREIGKLADCGFVDNELYISEELYDEYSKTGVPKSGDLMVTAVGTLGKTYIVKDTDRFYYKDASVICLENHGKISSQYLKYLIMCPYMETVIKENSSGTTVGTITLVKANEYLLPIPPLSEQYRIVAKIEELLPYIEKYGKAEEHLTALNTTFPEALKKSILQEAVQGKLIPQNPDDEPASILLERIRAEKQALIKAGKIKKDKYESVIVTRDDVPYEIPDNWTWCTLNDVVIQVADIDHKMPPTVEGEGFPYISPLDFTEDGIDYNKAKKIGKEDFEKLAAKIKPKRNDIIFPRYGTIGVIRLVETDIDFLVSYSCCTIQNTTNMDYRYIYYVLKSPLI